MDWSSLTFKIRRISLNALWIRARQARLRITERPIYRCVDFGALRTTSPVHRGFGIGRGKYIDRYYIEQFMRAHSNDIKGSVLAVGDEIYTLRFGGNKVTKSDILDIKTANNQNATIIGDLCSGEGLASNKYDCVILTQVLTCIFDVSSAINTTYRVLKPGGVVLATASGISQIASHEASYCGDFWRFTDHSLRRLFEAAFPSELVEVEPRGNVLTSIAFLHGLGTQELSKAELDVNDPEYQLCITVRATKPI